MSSFSLSDLERIIAERAASGDEGSWTAKLVAGGAGMAGKKLGEEAVETVIAAMEGSDQDMIGESADLIYHWLVLLHIRGIALDDVLAELQRRTGQSGIAEKASRQTG